VNKWVYLLIVDCL